MSGFNFSFVVNTFKERFYIMLTFSISITCMYKRNIYNMYCTYLFLYIRLHGLCKLYHGTR